MRFVIAAVLLAACGGELTTADEHAEALADAYCAAEATCTDGAFACLLVTGSGEPDTIAVGDVCDVEALADMRRCIEHIDTYATVGFSCDGYDPVLPPFCYEVCPGLID